MEKSEFGTSAETATQLFLERLAARDFDRLASSFATAARARFLLPRGLEEYTNREAIVRRIESWFGSASVFALTASTADVIGRRHRLSWRFTVDRDHDSREVIEQAAFLDLGPDGIEQIDLLCSGFLPDHDAGPAHVFDAGARGCADGLAQEFRRQLSAIPVGGALEVTVRDPAAKEDLPSLARLLGQRVMSTEAHDDGRLTITVERRK